MKNSFIILYLTICIATYGQNTDSLKVTSVPKAFGFPTFYKKYIEANGLPILSSEKVPDSALFAAREIVIQMLSAFKISGAIKQLNSHKIRVVVMSKNEVTTDIPEHSDLYKVFPATNWNVRARGCGATKDRPACSCAEENLLCYPGDNYKGESILVHEFAHTIHEMVLRYMEPGFNEKLKAIYENAITNGLWKNTYAISDFNEYWAEGVQDYFNTNLQAIPTDGIHNNINTREELKKYDPLLFKFISQYFIAYDQQIGCYPAGDITWATTEIGDTLKTPIDHINYSRPKKVLIAANDKPVEKLKFVILRFNFSKPVSNEMEDLNNLAREYDKDVLPVVINDSDLSKYKELFTTNEFLSLREFIAAKSQYQKHVTSFPVILILDQNGKIMHSWSGDKTDDGLKSSDFYTKIKAGLESISTKK